MTIVLGFIIVAASATLARVLLTANQDPERLPYRTLAVNLAGAFALGVIAASSLWDNPVVVSTAGLGSFTTFSTVAAESASLIEIGHLRRAIAYVGITIVAGVAVAWIGLSIGDSL